MGVGGVFLLNRAMYVQDMPYMLYIVGTFVGINQHAKLDSAM